MLSEQHYWHNFELHFFIPQASRICCQPCYASRIPDTSHRSCPIHIPVRGIRHQTGGIAFKSSLYQLFSKSISSSWAVFFRMFAVLSLILALGTLWHNKTPLHIFDYRVEICKPSPSNIMLLKRIMQYRFTQYCIIL